MVFSRTKWWKEGTAYQVWPASYKDSNGDGVGDIPGIISTLDYLRDLGVDYIWLSPMYDSPQADMGYDISDYENIYYKYGTLEDMETLIRELHIRGMRIMIDLVVNHTSSSHQWFKESSKSRDNPYSDWYCWRDPKIIDGKRYPPNNWRSYFSGSAWTYVEARDQYYLHLFDVTMPDLNWHNAATRQGIYKSAIEFWLSKGVDGFRVDVVNLYCKDPSFPDTKVLDPDSEYQDPDSRYFRNGPKMHEWLKEQRIQALNKYSLDIPMVGELHRTEPDEVLRYISAGEREIDTIFDFDLLNIGAKSEGKTRVTRFHHFLEGYMLSEMKTAIMKTQSWLSESCPVPDAWPTFFLENHDLPRSLSRFGSSNPKFRDASAKVLALMSATLSGSLFIYQGQEIGMSNMPSSWGREDLRDVVSLNYLDEMEGLYPGDESWKKTAMAGVHKMSRDNTRTPVQWTGRGKHAGFMKEGSQSEPWAPVNDNFKQGTNVEDQLKDDNSILRFWKWALTLRKEYKECLIYGVTDMIDLTNENVMTYTKTSPNGDVILVSLNFTEQEQKVVIPDGINCNPNDMILLTSTFKDNQATFRPNLAPWEGRAYLV